MMLNYLIADLLRKIWMECGWADIVEPIRPRAKPVEYQRRGISWLLLAIPRFKLAVNQLFWR